MSVWLNSNGQVQVDGSGTVYDCPDCPCGSTTVCSCGAIDVGPTTWTAVVTGWENDAGFCTDCDVLNRTITLSVNPYAPCIWVGDETTAICGSTDASDCCAPNFNCTGVCTLLQCAAQDGVDGFQLCLVVIYPAYPPCGSGYKGCFFIPATSWNALGTNIFTGTVSAGELDCGGSPDYGGLCKGTITITLTPG